MQTIHLQQLSRQDAVSVDVSHSEYQRQRHQQLKQKLFGSS